MKKLLKRSFSAFTMAEILLSLTIIGVVAAITLPSLTGNINERTWATQKKALYTRMSQAFPLLDSINSYDSAEGFISGALAPVIKINNICDADHIADCGLSTGMITPLNGTTQLTGEGSAGIYDTGWRHLGVAATDFSMTDEVDSATSSTKYALSNDLIAAFETGNGESIVLYYNPNCATDSGNLPNTEDTWINYTCINMIYDLNSRSGPNAIGRDMGFMTLFYPSDPVLVAPVPATTAASATCGSDEFRIPSQYEAMSMVLNNRYIVGGTALGATTIGTSGKGFNSSLSTPAMVTYRINGKKVVHNETTATNTRCVKR